MAVGTFAEMVIYSHIFKTKISEQPINILILSEHLVRHICSIILMASLWISLLVDATIREMIERFEFGNSSSYCWFFNYVGCFMVLYLNLNGLGIAIVRVVYIKQGSWLKHKFGEKKLIATVNILVTGTAVAMTYLFVVENSAKRSTFNMCMGHTEQFQVYLDVEFRQLQGDNF